MSLLLAVSSGPLAKTGLAIGNTGFTASSAGRKGAVGQSVGLSGITGSITARKMAIGSIVGNSGISGVDSSRKGGLGVLTGSFGLSGSIETSHSLVVISRSGGRTKTWISHQQAREQAISNDDEELLEILQIIMLEEERWAA